MKHQAPSSMNEWLIKSFFPVRLKSLREKEGMNQEVLARKLQVNQRTISNWEMSKAEPSLVMLLDLAFELNVDVEYLLCLDEKTYAFLSEAISRNLDLVITERYALDYLQRKVLEIPFDEKKSFLFRH